MAHVTLALVTLGLLISSTNGECYLRNGSSTNAAWAEKDRYSPCDSSSGGASMCCSQKYGGDTCVSLGRPALALCYNQGSNNLWRESCTDNYWSSNNCVKLFMNVTNTDVSITDCSENNLGEGYCYGHKNLGCCKAGMAVFIDPDTGNQVSTNPRLRLANSSTTSTTLSTSTAVRTSSSSPTSTSTTTASTSTSATATASPNTSLPSSTIHGIIAGVIVAIVLVLLICGIIVYHRVSRKRRAARARQPPSLVEIGSTDTKSKPYPPLEMPVSVYAHGNGRSELQDDSQEKLGNVTEMATPVQNEHIRRKPLSPTQGQWSAPSELPG